MTSVDGGDERGDPALDRLYELYLAMRKDRSLDDFYSELCRLDDEVWGRLRERFRFGDYVESGIQSALVTFMRRAVEEESDSKLLAIDGPEALIVCLFELARDKTLTKLREGCHGLILPGNDPVAPADQPDEFDDPSPSIGSQILDEMRSQLEQIRERVARFLGDDEGRRKATFLVLDKELGCNGLTNREIASRCGISERTVNRLVKQLRNDIDLEELIAAGRRRIRDLESRLRRGCVSQPENRGV